MQINGLDKEEKLAELLKKSLLSQTTDSEKDINKLVTELIDVLEKGKKEGLFDDKSLKDILNEEYPKPKLFYDALIACVEENNFEKAFTMFYEEYQKNPEAPVHMALGDMYYYGIGVKKDYREASKYYQEAIANHDTMASFAKSLAAEYYSRATNYLRGIEGEKDIQKAIEYFELSFKYGRLDAALTIANLYFKGEEVEINNQKAIEYWKMAATQGSLDQKYRPDFDKQSTAIAYNNLGYMYYELNKEGNKNNIKPLEYFKTAASLDLADGYANVGRCYALGIGVERNKEEAKRWYQYGYDLGSKFAQEYLELSNIMPKQKK